MPKEEETVSIPKRQIKKEEGGKIANLIYAVIPKVGNPEARSSLVTLATGVERGEKKATTYIVSSKYVDISARVDKKQEPMPVYRKAFEENTLFGCSIGSLDPDKIYVGVVVRKEGKKERRKEKCLGDLFISTPLSFEGSEHGKKSEKNETNETYVLVLAEISKNDYGEVKVKEIELDDTYKELVGTAIVIPGSEDENRAVYLLPPTDTDKKIKIQGKEMKYVEKL